MSFSKQKTITVTADDFVRKDSIGHAEFTSTEGNPCLVQVVKDEGCESPREWDNLWTWVTGHNAGYSDNKGETPEDFMDGDGNLDKEFLRKNLVRPLYLYRHSGDVISTSDGHYPFSDPWDSGCMGFAYLNKEKTLKKHGWKRFTKERVKGLVEVLKSEVATMNTWLSGGAYGVSVVDLVTEVDDSCWGFICDDRKGLASMVRDMLGSYVEKHEEREAIAEMVMDF